MNSNLVNLKEKYIIQRDILNKKVTILAVIRFVFFILAFIFLFIAVFKNNSNTFKTINYILAGTSFITFIILAIIHSKIFSKYDNILFRISSIDDYEKRSNTTWRHFQDTGIEFLDKKNYYEQDLDLFGNSSLYQYLNVSKTGYGRREFANLLKDKDISKEEILSNQESVKELYLDYESHIEFEAILREYNKKNDDNRASSMDNALNSIEADIKKTNYLFVSIISVIGLFTILILCSLSILKWQFLLIALIANFFITMIVSTPIKDIRTNLTPIDKAFKGYDKIIDYLSIKEYKSSKLKELKNNISIINSKSIKSFNILNSIISSRDNILFKIIFNSIFALDTFMSYLYKKWSDNHKNKIRVLIESIAKIEGLLSLSVLPLSKDLSILPTITNEFTFKDLKHPLIEEDRCVSNSFDFNGMNIITGSNMSGKTTFMRTIGVNYLLFKAGGYINGSSFNSNIYKLFTSMKVTDDVSNGISTFYGEILRIKDIIEYTKNNEPMLVLIDEIFKGTNTADRITGALEVINKLNKKNILSIITTHDFELCEVAGCKNYHFLEYYEDNKIMFDYKIHNGKSTTRNAVYLLKMAGIIDDLK